MIPVIEVTHVPSSASFYAAVCQPLGIHFIPYTSPSSSSVDFGLPATPSTPCEILFTLSTASKPQKSAVKFRASCPDAVTDFHWRALQANYNSVLSKHMIAHTAEESTASVTDLDGNILEARFSHRNSTPVISNTKESRRVMDWQRDVALSLSDEGGLKSSPPRRKSSPQDPGPLNSKLNVEHRPHLQHRETIATVPDTTSDGRILSGMSNQALFGTILGAAAGAAVAYAMVKSEEPPKAELARPGMVSYHTSPPVPSPRVEEVERTVEAMSIRTPSHAGSGSRQNDLPTHVVKYSVANGNGSLRDIDEEKSVSHRSHRSHRSREGEGSSGSRKAGSDISKSSRHTSKSKKAEEPLSASPTSQVSRSSRKERDSEIKSKTGSKANGSHVSTRSESTAKPTDKARSKAHTTLTVSNKEAVDRASQRGSVVTAREVPLPESTYTVRPSRKGSVMSARDVPLPESTYTVISARKVPLPESTYSYAHSIAPSDSISSIGMKRERNRRMV
jgi:hypothetical protein